MTKQVSKGLALLVCIGMLLSVVITGCGSKDNNNQPQDQQAISSEKTAAPTEASKSSAGGEKKKISLWHIQTTTPEIIQHAVDRYTAKNPNVEVEVVPLQNDPYKTKLKVAMGSGTTPDIFISWTGGPLYEYIKAGQVADITDLMDKDNYKDRFMDASVNMATFDGKIWAVPVENVAVAVVFYNKKIFADNGLSVPTTHNELLEIVKKLKAKGIAPFALANKTKWTGLIHYIYMVDRLGGAEVFSKAATRSGSSFEDEAFIKAGQMIQDLVKMGAFAEGYNGLDWDTGQSRNLMYAGKAAMEIMGTWNIFTVKAENEEFFKNNLGIFPIPAVEGGKGDPNNLIGTIGDNFYSIAKNSKYRDTAFEVIQYLIDDESVKERAAAGKIPPIKGFTPEEPMLKEVMALVEKSSSVTLWADQYLPPELGELIKDTSQAVFGLDMKPEEAAKKMEEGAKKFYGN